MKYWVLALFVSMMGRAGLGFASTSLTDDTVLAILPKTRIQGLPMEEAMYSLQKKAGRVDPSLAVSLASKYLQMGAMTDDVRRYGGALAILESVPAEQRASLEYQRSLADVQSLLHEFNGARSTLALVLAGDPKDDLSRRKLLYLELLRGDVGEARKHCHQKSGFSDVADSSLCIAHTSLAAGKLLTEAQEKAASLGLKNKSLDKQLWAADILLDQRFLQCLKVGEEGCVAFKKYVETYLQTIGGEKTRLAYVADRLMMAGFFEEALKTLPENTKNLALATRRLGLLTKARDPSQWTDSDRELQKIVLGGLGSEVDRGQVEHAREASLIAFFVDKNTAKAKDLALLNWRTQREWIDLWLMHQAMTSSPDKAISSAVNTWSTSQSVAVPFGGLQ